LGGCAAVYYHGQAEAAIFALAALQSTFTSLLWPASTALLPSLATTPAQLIAANSVNSTAEGLGMLAGPIGAGVLVATTSPAAVFALAAGAFLWVALMIASIRVEGR